MTGKKTEAAVVVKFHVGGKRFGTGLELDNWVNEVANHWITDLLYITLLLLLIIKSTSQILGFRPLKSPELRTQV